jgi:Glyoxalase-like domain
VTSRLDALCFDANEPLRLARFWAGALGWELSDEAGEEIRLVPTDGTGFAIEFSPTPVRKKGKNRIHLDLTSTSVGEQSETVRRLVELGRDDETAIRAPDGRATSVGS